WTIDQALENPNCNLVGVADSHEHLIKKAKEKLPEKIRLFEDYRQMLEELKPDAAMIITPNNEHLEVLLECAKRGIHCFVQKPMATSYADAVKMEEAARRSGIELMVNCFSLWRPELRECLRLYREGKIGPALKFIAYNGHQGHRGIGVLTEDYINWLYDPVRSGGGALADQASYAINYAVYMLGLPETVYAVTHIIKLHENTNVEDDSVVVLKYPSATAVIQGSYIWPFAKSEVQVYGSAGGLMLKDQSLRYEHVYSKETPSQKKIDEIAIPETAPEAKNGITHFIHSLQHHKPFEEAQTAIFNTKVMRVVDAAYESAKTGSPVQF
ncbi:MAG TPA: Gfo/Idh/MocA family oxidoreductase, partial [Anaerovoracaceae bacterium]|nr:Gfo/Idh/MocA family oxidoreductase [Anaerovoracaceae bacterium]